MTHPPAGGSGAASNERNNRLGIGARVVLLEVCGSLLLHGTSDLTDKDDTLSLGVSKEDLDDVNVLCSGEGVASDSDGEGLAKTSEGGLVHGLVCEGSGTRNDTDLALGEDVAGHDAELAGLAHNTGAVTANHARLGLGSEGIVDLELVALWDTLGDGDDEGDLRLDGLENGIGGTCGGNVDYCCEGVLCLLCLADGTEDGETKVGLASFLQKSEREQQ